MATFMAELIIDYPFNRGAVLSMIQVNSRSTQLFWLTHKTKLVLYGLITTGSYIFVCITLPL